MQTDNTYVNQLVMFRVHFGPLVMLELDVEHVQLLGVEHRDVLQDLGEVLLHRVSNVESELVAEITNT